MKHIYNVVLFLTRKCSGIIVIVRFLTLPCTGDTWRQRRLLCTCIYTALLSWITNAHLVPLSVTKRRPVHFILNPGHVEYELGGLMVVSRSERDSNPRYPAWKSSALTTRPPSLRSGIIAVTYVMYWLGTSIKIKCVLEYECVIGTSFCVS